MSGVHCHMHAFSTSSCAFVYFTVQYYIEYSSTVSYFKPRMSGSKCKSSSKVAGTAKKHQAITMELAVQHEELTNEDLTELEALGKHKERQEEEEVTEELKRFMTQKMARDFLYLRRHCWFLKHRTRT